MPVSLDLEQEMDLKCGSYAWQGFQDEAERQIAWTRHRERLIAESHPGTRPEAWWRYERPDLFRGRKPSTFERETALLRKHGLLRPDELRALAERKAQRGESGGDDV